MFDTVGIVCEVCGLTVAEIGERGMQERERADIVVGKWNKRANFNGIGEFTIESWFDGIKLSPPIPHLPKGEWVDFSMVRNADCTTVHTEEEIDGVLFFAVIQYDKEGKMLSKQLTRADLLKG